MSFPEVVPAYAVISVLEFEDFEAPIIIRLCEFDHVTHFEAIQCFDEAGASGQRDEWLARISKKFPDLRMVRFYIVKSLYEVQEEIAP